MRNGQNKRMRGRNNNHSHGHSQHHGGGHRKNHNPMARVYESNGPEVKIRGNPAHIAEKYMQLARDAQTSGDPVSAENYFQHAEHYFRLIAAAQEQFRLANPHLARPENEGPPQGARDEGFDEGEDDGQQPMMSGSDQPFGTREPQPYVPPNAQPFPQYQQPQPQPAAAASGRARIRAAAANSRATSPSSRPSSPADRVSRSRVRRATARTATTTRAAIASRCIAAGAAIAARARRTAATPAPVTSASSRGVLRKKSESVRDARAVPRASSRQAPPGEGASAGSSAGTSRLRSRLAGMAR